MNASDVKDALSAATEDIIDRVKRAALGDAPTPRVTEGAPGTVGRVSQMNLSDGGVPKLPVAEARVTKGGIVGDRQKHTVFHGGPERAVSLFSLEVIERLRAEGHPIEPGSTGENVTVAGLDWPLLAPGSRLALGDEVVLEITGFAAPCATIRASFAGGRFKRISQKVNPGESRLYARVLREGRITAGDHVRVLGEAES
ncbi:MAG TPA: MOSC domain-containing protein [Pyrinomonadaceae bacterium]|nr:MOSC domain-containing protein [Pyrinomonadaceae bacterium]